MSVLGGLTDMGHDIADVASSAGHAGLEVAEAFGDGAAAWGHRFAAAGDAMIGDREGIQRHLDASDADVDLKSAHLHQAKEYLMGNGGDGSSDGDSAVSSYAGDGSDAGDGFDGGDDSYYLNDYAMGDDGDGSDTADGSYGYDTSGDDYGDASDDGAGSPDDGDGSYGVDGSSDDGDGGDNE